MSTEEHGTTPSTRSENQEEIASFFTDHLEAPTQLTTQATPPAADHATKCTTEVVAATPSYVGQPPAETDTSSQRATEPTLIVDGVAACEAKPTAITEELVAPQQPRAPTSIGAAESIVARVFSALKTPKPDFENEDVSVRKQQLSSAVPSLQDAERTKLEWAVPEGLKPVCSLLLWKQPIKTTGILLLVQLFFYYILWSQYTLLTLVCRFHLAILLAFAVHVYGNKFAVAYLGFEPRAKENLHSTPLTQETLKELIAPILAVIDTFLQYAVKVFYFKEPRHSFGAFVTLYIASKIGKHFSGVTLAYCFTLSLFMLPPLYMRYKDKVDRKLWNVYEHLEVNKIKLREALRGAIKKKSQ
ncbi:Reticulon [Pelomyxa schiedti]|nr:Reticulon [Pelomyxa schiedti]